MSARPAQEVRHFCRKCVLLGGRLDTAYPSSSPTQAPDAQVPGDRRRLLPRLPVQGRDGLEVGQGEGASDALHEMRQEGAACAGRDYFGEAAAERGADLGEEEVD